MEVVQGYTALLVLKIKFKMIGLPLDLKQQSNRHCVFISNKSCDIHA